MVSEDLAVTPEGEVKNIETGEIVADPTLVGTQDQQPDPLAKTNGESFIPVSAEDVKNAVADANVQLSKFESNEYGAHWALTTIRKLSLTTRTTCSYSKPKA